MLAAAAQADSTVGRYEEMQAVLKVCKYTRHRGSSKSEQQGMCTAKAPQPRDMHRQGPPAPPVQQLLLKALVAPVLRYQTESCSRVVAVHSLLS